MSSGDPNYYPLTRLGVSMMYEHNSAHGSVQLAHVQARPHLEPSGTYTIQYGDGPSGFRRRMSMNSIQPLEWILPLAEDFFLTSEGLAGMPAQLEGIRARAYQRMVPSLTTGFSLPVFLGELLDVSRLFKSLGETASFIYSLPHKGWRNLNDLSRVAAGDHLAWSFGIRPMISDLQEICVILSSLTKRVRRFLTSAERLEQRRRFRTSVSAQEFLELFTPRVDIEGGSVALTPNFEPHAGFVQNGEFAVVNTMDFSYYVQTLIDVDNRLLGIWQSLGIKPDASIIWELIPFSFVVDWFVKVGDFLSDYGSMDVISADVNIHMFTESIRARVTYSPDWRSFEPARPDVYLVGVDGDATSFLTSQYYFRYFAEPNTEAVQFVTDGDINLNRVALSASLLRRIIRK